MTCQSNDEVYNVPLQVGVYTTVSKYEQVIGISISIIAETTTTITLADFHDHASITVINDALLKLNTNQPVVNW